MRFPPHILDEIRERVPISTVVGRAVTWDQRKSQPTKGDYWACCPFHNEKTPSFHCDDRRQRYHCFGCGATGDIFRFLTEREGYPFPEAVEQLAAEAGVPLPKADPKQAAAEQERASLGDWMEEAATFYENHLRRPAGRAALDYALGRGFRDATLLQFRFGYAPNQRDALLRHLVAKGATPQELAQAGLITMPEDGRAPYDRMRDRLIIPICDRRGRVIGFGGRSLTADREPKYLNSPESSLFSKRRTLYNWHLAREPAHRSGQIIVVEGYLDAIAVFQAGVQSVVAALGTAFTEEQITALWQLADEPVLCFDGDKAGRAAAFRAIDRMLPLLSAGKSFRLVFLPEGQDPDDLIKASGRDAFLDEVQSARPLHDILWEREVERTRLDTPERRARLDARIDELIAEIKDQRVAKAYRFTLRLKLNDLLRGQTERAVRGLSAGAAAARAARLKRPVGITAPKFTLTDDRIERSLLGLSVHLPELFDTFLERIMAIDLASEALARFRASLQQKLAGQGGLTAGDVALPDPAQSGPPPQDEALVQALLRDSGTSEMPTLDAGGLDARSLDSEPSDAGPNEAGTSDAGHEAHFAAILADIYGPLVDGERRPDALHALLPILTIGLPQHLLIKLFEGLLARLELRDMRREYEQEVADIGDELSAADEDRLMALLRDIQRRGEEIDRHEHVISEHLAVMRKSNAV